MLSLFEKKCETFTYRLFSLQKRFVHFFASGFLDHITSDDFKGFAVIQRIMENVQSHPKLSAHMAAGNV
jgi:hypothetical protein